MKNVNKQKYTHVSQSKNWLDLIDISKIICLRKHAVKWVWVQTYGREGGTRLSTG